MYGNAIGFDLVAPCATKTMSKDTDPTDNAEYSLDMTVSEHSDDFQDGDRETVHTVMSTLGRTFQTLDLSTCVVEVTRFNEALIVRISGDTVVASTDSIRRNTDVSRVDMLAYCTGNVKIKLKD